MARPLMQLWWNVFFFSCGLSGSCGNNEYQSIFGNRSNNNILSLFSKSIIANGMMQKAI
jgi:hypothetical protein